MPKKLYTRSIELGFATNSMSRPNSLQWSKREMNLELEVMSDRTSRHATSPLSMRPIQYRKICNRVRNESPTMGIQITHNMHSTMHQNNPEKNDNE